MVNYIVKNLEKGTDGKTNANFILWCDNESVPKAIDPKMKSTFAALCKPEGALVHQTCALLQQLRKVSLNHVEGHQDESVPYQRLPLPARLNVDCNTRAKNKMQETGVMCGRAPPHPQGTEVAFYIGEIWQQNSLTRTPNSLCTAMA